MPCTKSDLVSSINTFANARISGDQALVQFAAQSLNEVLSTLEFSEEKEEEKAES